MLHPAQRLGGRGTNASVIVANQLEKSLRRRRVGNCAEELRRGDSDGHVVRSRVLQRRRTETRLRQRLGDAQSRLRCPPGVLLQKISERTGDDAAHSKKGVLHCKTRLGGWIGKKLE